jgi:replicative DNA helicase
LGFTLAGTGRELYQQVQRRLIASLIYDGTATNRVLELVRPDDFSEPMWETVFSCIMELARRDELISVISVAHLLEQRGALEQLGGVAGLYQLHHDGERYLLQGTPELYAQVVRESAAKNRASILIESAQPTFKDNSGIPAVEAISNLTSEFNDVLFRLSDDSTIINVASYKDDYFELLNNRKRITQENDEKSDGLQGIPTLLPTLNKYTLGWSPQQLITVGARTGIGKSVFAVMALVAAARAGKSVLFFSLEMSHDSIIDRIVACMSGVSQNRLKRGKLTPEDRVLVEEAYNELCRMKIMIDTDPKATVDSIRSKAFNRAQSPDGLDMVILDYLQLVTPVGRFGTRQEAVADLSRSMKLTAKTLGVPIMILVQLNNKDDEEEGKLPTLDNIRESRSIAMDSDVVVLLHRDLPQDDTTPHTLVVLAKNRDGEANKIIRCHTNLECSIFREIKREKEIDERLTEEEMEEMVDDMDFSEFDPDNLDDDLSIQDL